MSQKMIKVKENKRLSLVINVHKTEKDILKAYKFERDKSTQ